MTAEKNKKNKQFLNIKISFRMHRNQMTHYSPMRRILNQRMVRTGMGASNYFQQTR